MPDQIPVIDLFAGPGGLGEGFSRFESAAGSRPFRISLSIEKEATAHETLLLRSFFRQSDPEHVPDAYYQFLRGEITRAELFRHYPADASAATNEAWHAELGVTPADEVRSRIRQVLGGRNDWALIGGPPCQAYSLVGRSRNKGNNEYKPAEDRRQYLYVEYLQIIADHWPAVFVMENVKGLLSAKLEKQSVFDRIRGDLESPVEALQRERRAVHSRNSPHTYELFSLVEHSLFGDSDVRDFVVCTEDYGIPQARHRLILVGVRDDLRPNVPTTLKKKDEVTVRDVLDGLPRLRSGLSRVPDSPEAWQKTLTNARPKRWLKSAGQCGGDEVFETISRTIESLALPRSNRGAEFIRCEAKANKLEKWLLDARIEGVCNHSTRGHMTDDLYRYLYAACFAKVRRVSPALADFPKDLLPDHHNVPEALDGSLFADRFRVQLADRPSTTVTSHIAKDGHYYIHYDPSQCRSLTVREAARLQTFPDNYFFCGPRTSQYAQVGNAVPPLLARQIAEIVYKLLN